METLKIENNLDNIIGLIIDCAAGTFTDSEDFNTCCDGLEDNVKDLHEAIDPLTDKEKKELKSMVTKLLRVEDGWNKGDRDFFNKEFGWDIGKRLSRVRWKNEWYPEY